MSSPLLHNAPVLGVILAGGSSRRMGGRDKFLLSLDGKQILQHIIARLKPQVDVVILNTRNVELKCSLEVVPDIKSQENGEPYGPLGGLYTALSYAKKNGYSFVVTAPCDTPFIPDNFVLRLLEHKDKLIVTAKSKGQLHPVLSLWNVSLLSDLEKALDNKERKMMSWISKYNPVEVVWDQEPDPFLNINTSEDLLEAEKMILKNKLF
jgi:molybdenum cofactor guanylyltransferase